MELQTESFVEKKLCASIICLCGENCRGDTEVSVNITSDVEEKG